MAAQARHLDVAGVLSDVRVVEHTGRVRLLERPPREDVVEHHRDAERADLDRDLVAVPQLEAQDQGIAVEEPRPGDGQGQRGREGGSEVGRGQHRRRRGPRTHRRARGRRGVVGPLRFAGLANPQIEIPEVVVPRA